jgi:hypothetical protein
MPGRSTARRSGSGTRRKSALSPHSSSRSRGGAGVTDPNATPPSSWSRVPCLSLVLLHGTWSWLCSSRVGSRRAALSLAGMCSLTRCAACPSERKGGGTSKKAGPGGEADPRRTDGQTASRQGKCSPAVKPAPEYGTDQRFRWSEPMWSPPPESNRRPHPYHGTTRNRCANRHFPRSRPTAGAKVIGSLPAKLSRG